MLEEAKLLDDDVESAAAKRTWGTKLTAGGVSYATSLFWQPLQNASDPFQEVEEASAGVLEGADLFCIKSGKAPQFGICVSAEGYKSGENVAAVALATALSDISSFIAVFKTNEGWWYTCVRNDIILSDGDMLFLTEQEAKDQFMSMLAVPDWGKKIAPKDWAIEDTEEIDLTETLSRGAKSRLQKIKALRGGKLLAVVVVSAVVGIWLISMLIDKLFLTPTVRPMVVPVKPKAAPMAIQRPKEYPWNSVPNPILFMQNCYNGVVSLSKIMPPGWMAGPIVCKDDQAGTTWTRDVGQISWAKKALRESGLTFSGYNFASDGNTLTAALLLPKSVAQVSPPERTAVALQEELNDLFQKIGIQVTLSEQKITSSKFDEYQIVGFSLDSTYNPLVWTDLLTKYSGLEIKLITYTPQTKIWHYEGVFYVL